VEEAKNIALSEVAKLTADWTGSSMSDCQLIIKEINEKLMKPSLVVVEVLYMILYLLPLFTK
jgi:hypothetical protein